MKLFYLLLLWCCAREVQAHGADLSNLMVYQQNDKYFLVIKSSLTAFEGEINYLFSKNAYKTAEAFQLLAIKHFQNNCLVLINDDTIKLNHPKIILGHETTLFAELSNVPNTVRSIYVRNTLFKDIPGNMCELILSLNDLAQKQYILNKDNKYEVHLKVEKDNWILVKAANASYESPNLLLWGGVLLAVLALVMIVYLAMGTGSVP